MKIAVCENCKQEMDDLIMMIEAHPLECKVSGRYYSAEQLLDDYAKGARYNLLFLDIQMEGIDGYAAAMQLRKLYVDEMPLIIFVTVTNKYVFAGYDIGAFGYFLKPVDEEHLYRKLYQAYEDIGSNSIIVNCGSETAIVPIKKIMYIESDRNNIKMHLTTEILYIRMTIEEIKAKLPQQNFIQTHRSFIVNLAQVSRYNLKNVFFVPSGSVPISRQKSKEFQLCLDDYLRRQCIWL